MVLLPAAAILCALPALAGNYGYGAPQKGQASEPEASEQYSAPSSRRAEEKEEAPPKGSGEEPAEAPPGSEAGTKSAAEPMSLGDAKINFGTVVKTFVGNAGRDGLMPVQDKRAGRSRRLALEGIREETVRRVRPNVFAGTAAMRDSQTRELLEVQFTVDFGGEEWKVSGVKFAPTGPLTQEEKDRELEEAYADAVKAHLLAGTTRKTGFPVADDVMHQTWKTKFLRLRLETFTALPDGQFFACADFKELGGKRLLDVDIYARRSGKTWKVEDLLIHKISGKPRFTYDETNHRVPFP